MNRLERVKKWYADWGEVEEKDFNWLIEQVELLEIVKERTGLIISRKLSTEEIEKFKKEWNGVI